MFLIAIGAYLTAFLACLTGTLYLGTRLFPASIGARCKRWRLIGQTVVVHWLLAPFIRIVRRSTGAGRFLPQTRIGDLTNPKILSAAINSADSSSSSSSSVSTKNKLVSVEVVRGQGLHGGYIGDMFKLSLKWQKNDNDEKTKGKEQATNNDAGDDDTQQFREQRLVVKSTRPRYRSVLLGLSTGSSREAFFYRHFGFRDRSRSDRPSFRDILPQVVYAEGCSISGELLILLDDLSSSTILGSHILGNQCWGAVDIPKEFQVDPVVFLETVFLGIADVHAAYWRDVSLLRLGSWMKHADWLLGKDRATWELAVQSAIDKWKLIKKALASGKIKTQWSPKLVEQFDRTAENTSWSNFRKNFNIAKSDTPFTLCHGDFHAGNTLWSTSSSTSSTKSPQWYMIDWSEVGVFCPFTDLAQFMVSNATTDLRRKHELEIFKKYHRRLIEKGVDETEFPFETCWERYKAGGIERWFSMLTLLTTMGLDNPQVLPESAVHWFQSQVAAFVEDHADSCKRPQGLMTAYCIL